MPIGDVYKTQIFALAKWLIQKFGKVLPVEVIARAPSAELKAGQKDEDVLPKYEILDAVLQAYLSGASKKELEETYSSELVHQIVKTYHKMAYKRKQMPELVKI